VGVVLRADALVGDVPYARRVRARATAGTVLSWCWALAFPVAAATGEAWGAGPDGGLLVLSIAVVVVALVGVVRLLERHPLAALGIGLAGIVVGPMTSTAWEFGYLQVLAVDLAVLYIVATRPARVAVAAVAMALGTELVLAGLAPTSYWTVETAVAVVVLAMITTGTVGWAISQRREHAVALQVQATAQAVTAERLRIARELHDVISHSIGSIAIQAGVGRRVIDTQPAEARNALAAIEATSREALAGLRRTLGALRRSDPEPGAGSALGATLVDPTPGLDDLDRLVGSLADAGVRVAVVVVPPGRRRPLPPDLDLAAFRVVQEALTNVVRHAGTAACRVTLDYDPGGDGGAGSALAIEVDDDGRGGSVDGTGYGIVGMRERGEVLGGRLHAGPRPEGGFRVSALLPLAEAGG
jgi:signal transduction histidine kinase